MKKRQKLLTDEQWELIEPLLPKPRPRLDKRGRPPASALGFLEDLFHNVSSRAVSQSCSSLVDSSAVMSRLTFLRLV